MSAPQTWVVVATTEQRFYLAELLLSDSLKIRGRKADTQLWRARVALGLISLTELIMRESRVRNDLLRAPERHLFTVTAENAEFLLEQREKVEIGTGVSAVLRPLLEQLADAKVAAELAGAAGDVPEWSGELEAAEIERWRPPRKTDPPDAA